MTPRFLRMFAVRLCAVVALCLVSMLLILQSKVSPELPTESAPKAAPLKTLFKTTSLSRNALVAAPEYYLLSLSPSPENAQLMSATLKVAVEGCPTAKPALIGILTTAEQYRKQNEQLPEDQQIEIMFLLGREHSYEKRFQIQTEQSLHPTDTLITNRTENANEGKILDWFQYARSVLYTRHPTSPNQYCKRAITRLVGINSFASKFRGIPCGSGRISQTAQ
ncbi:hypothetical protein BDR26DRAFT_857250 [Obelidium mucronatum]|nr:hypothetical protein BDR26DRAFT_857250 [Obelidium mucronatum]